MPTERRVKDWLTECDHSGGQRVVKTFCQVERSRPCRSKTLSGPRTYRPVQQDRRGTAESLNTILCKTLSGPRTTCRPVQQDRRKHC